LGRWKFLLAYLLTGLTSAMGSLLLNDYAVSAGASGSIFGMYGVFFALLTTNFLEKENRMSTLKSIGIFLVFNLALGGSIGADNGGHLGGLAGGLFIGYCYYFIFLKPESGLLNFLIISFMTFILIGGTAYGYFNISDPVGTYQKKLDAFTINEQKAQNLYSELNTTDTSIMAKNIQKELSLWAENISLIQESTTLKLPKEFELRNVLLQRYAQLRFQIFRFALQDLRHPSPENKKQLENYTSEMEYILKKLNTKEETSD